LYAKGKGKQDESGFVVKTSVNAWENALFSYLLSCFIHATYKTAHKKIEFRLRSPCWRVLFPYDLNQSKHAASAQS
jgi:hypothetical protein